MKILVFSDSHGAEQHMIDVILENRDADTIVFLGDGERDFEEALAGCGIAPYGPDQSVKTLQVCGNCDRYSMEPVTFCTDLGGIKTLITHGHDQNVKLGYAGLCGEAQRQGCKAVLFGHTHLQHTEEKNGILLVNPGSIRSGKYAVITVKDHKAVVALKKL